MNFQDLLSNFSKADKDVAPKQAPVRSAPAYEHPLYRLFQSTWSDKTANRSLMQSSTKFLDEPLHIGMLLIVIDDLPHEATWRLWSHEIQTHNNGCRVSYWIHAKEPHRIRSQWVRDRLVKSFHFRPTWGSLEITKVMDGLLKEAVADDASVTHFIFASESCIPVATLAEFKTALSTTIASSSTSTSASSSLSSSSSSSSSGAHDYVRQQSWVKYTNEPNDGYAKTQQFDVLQGRIPSQCIYKSDQWTLLSRCHAIEIVELMKRGGDQFWSVFNKLKASDEMFVACCLSILGHIPSSDPAVADDANDSDVEVVRRQVTYADWSQNTPSPKTFHELSDELFGLVQGGGHLLCRKLKLRGVGSAADERIALGKQWIRLVFGAAESEDINELLERFVAESLTSGSHSQTAPASVAAFSSSSSRGHDTEDYRDGRYSHNNSRRNDRDDRDSRDRDRNGNDKDRYGGRDRSRYDYGDRQSSYHNSYDRGGRIDRK